MIMNVLETSSHGDRPMCQIGYANVKGNRSYRSDMKTWHKSIKLYLRSKGNIESGTWMYMSDLLIVIDPCAKYGKPMFNQKLVMGRTQKHVKNPINLTFTSKLKVVSACWIMNVRDTSSYGDTPMCHICCQCQTKKSYGPDTNLPDRRTDRQTDRKPPLNFVHGGIIN